MALSEKGGEAADSVLARLALASTSLHPDHIADVVADEVARAGLGDATLYLACLEQRELRLLGPRRAGDDARPIAIGDSPAAIAYRTERPVIEELSDGNACVWLPLMDSAERLGVMSVQTDASLDEAGLIYGQAIANLVAELISNKKDYGDVFTRTRRTRELTIAAELRWSMLPPLTFTGRNLTITGIVAPAYEIAGDTFDYAVNGDVAHVTILDAVGHGLEAARIANLAVGTYRNSRRAGMTPVETYRAMNDTIAEQFGSEKFATAQLATADLMTGRLCWVNAGHPSPMVIRGGRRVDLTSDVWLPVGLADAEHGDPPISETQLEPGDLVVFFTDGVVEARSSTGIEFGRDRLAGVLERASAASEKPAEILRLVAVELQLHQRDVLQDDATLLLLAWDGPPAQS